MLTFIMQKGRFGLQNVEQVIVRDAVNVLMDQVVYRDTGVNTTLLTDGLATCVAIAMYGDGGDFPLVFTHMSNGLTGQDNERKTVVLTDMLNYLLRTHDRSQLRMVISPPSIKDKFLMQFIQSWVDSNGVYCHQVNTGGDSAIFNIAENGNALMVSTSLLNLSKTPGHCWNGKGIVIRKQESISNHCPMENDRMDFKQRGATSR